MKKSMLFLASLFFALGAQSQNFGEIKGRLVDADTGEPIVYVSVFIDMGTSMVGDNTDEEGRFKLKPLPPGSYDLTVTSMEYADIKHTDIVVKPNEITVLPDLTLASATSLLPELVITTFVRPLIVIDDPVKISIGGTDLEQRADVRDTPAMIAGLVPGLTLSNGPTRELHFRGARPQNFATFIDGVKVSGGIIPRVPSNAINNLTVYTGGIPASYGDVTGGVVIIETKGYFDLYRESKRNK